MASLPSLAELEDVEDRLGRDLEASESRRAQALLRDASMVVRSYCRRDFTAGTTTARYRPRGRKIVLPNRPVTDVSVVSTVLSYGTTETVIPLAFWQWPGGSEIFIGDPGLWINGPTGLDFDDSNAWCEVTYDHGYPEIPTDIVSVVCAMVVRNLTVPANGTVDSETIGPYTMRFSGPAVVGPLGLGEAERQVLNRYRAIVSHTVELRG